MSRVFEALCAHLKTHPEAEVQDAVKFLYQASFGGGHFLSDPDGAYQYLLKEAEIATVMHRTRKPSASSTRAST